MLQNDRDYITSGPASHIAACSVASIHRAAADGILPHKRIAGYLFFKQGDVEKFAAERSKARTNDDKGTRTCDNNVSYRHHGKTIIGLTPGQHTSPQMTHATLNKRNRDHYKSKG